MVFTGATCLIAAGDPRSATVTTTSDTLVMNITYDDFDSVMQHEPELRKGMMTGERKKKKNDGFHLFKKDGFSVKWRILY